MRIIRPGTLVPAVAALLLPVVAGCNIVSAIAYFFGPQQIQKAEFRRTDGRLALFVDWTHPEQANPVFTQALHEKLTEVFRDHNVRTQLIPQEEIYRLRQQNRDFDQWSIQKVGQRLNAKQVLYVRIDELQLREAPDSPVMLPAVRLRMRVVDPQAAKDQAVLWPTAQERDGREAARARQHREFTDPVAVDEEAAKLGKDTAWLVSAPFYDVDLEQRTPWEP
jgi:hypothetical protein